MKAKPSIPKIVEFLFDALYLSVVLVLGVYLLVGIQSKISTMWGIMALVLVVGDAFHLIPRMIAVFDKTEGRYLFAQGLGKMLTSNTMTVFYVLLWHCGLHIFLLQLPLCTALVYALAITRIALCLCPQNGWTQIQPAYKWAIYRNIPFVMQGALVLWLYACYGTAFTALNLMWLAIALSFLLYIPVVLFAGKYPKLGMLMLAKSCAYVWIVIMGMAL